MNDAQRTALRAAMRLNYPSFPCNADKTPACPHGFKDAALPEMGLASLWARYPGELIGVPPGPHPALTCLTSIRKTAAANGTNRCKLPATRIHRTRSGGVHILFRHLDGLRNSAGKVASGVDVRADGGYVVWWPATGLRFNDHPLAQLPEWPLWMLPSLMSAPKPPAPVYPRPTGDVGPASLRAVEGIIRAVATAPQGRRNCVVYWAAHRMRERVDAGQVTARLARDLLINAAGQCGLSQREASAAVNSAMVGDARG